MSTSTIERPQVADPELAQGEGRKTHIVPKDKGTEAYVYGNPVTALCGYTWVPSHDPKNFPLCQQCKEIGDAAWGEGSAENLE